MVSWLRSCRGGEVRRTYRGLAAEVLLLVVRHLDWIEEGGRLIDWLLIIDEDTFKTRTAMGISTFR